MHASTLITNVNGCVMNADNRFMHLNPEMRRSEMDALSSRRGDRNRSSAEQNMNNQARTCWTLWTLGVILLVVGGGISAAWVEEARTIGRGFVSTWLAPLGLTCIITATCLGLVLASIRLKQQSIREPELKTDPLE